MLSKGHAAPILWAALKEAGAISDDLLTLRRYDSPLEGHPTPQSPWVRVASGSLGQGLAAAAGMAWARKLDGSAGRVFALLGDGEAAEGAVFEAAQYASFNKLDNLCAILDVNRLGQSGPDHVPARRGRVRRSLRGVRLAGGRGGRARRFGAPRRLRAGARRVGPALGPRGAYPQGQGRLLPGGQGGVARKAREEGRGAATGARSSSARRTSPLPFAPRRYPAPARPSGRIARDHARLHPGPGGGDPRGLRHRPREARPELPRRRGHRRRHQELHVRRATQGGGPRPLLRGLHRRAEHGGRGPGHGHRGQDPLRLDLRLLLHAGLRLHPHGRLLAAAPPGAGGQPRRASPSARTGRRRWPSRISR